MSRIEVDPVAHRGPVGRELTFIILKIWRPRVTGFEHQAKYEAMEISMFRVYHKKVKSMPFQRSLLGVEIEPIEGYG